MVPHREDVRNSIGQALVTLPEGNSLLQREWRHHETSHSQIGE